MGFTVFSDSGPSSSHSKSSSKSSSTSRKAHSVQDSLGKENVDPFSRSKFLKGKSIEKVACAPAKVTRTEGIKENGICTGLLFTRILETPPPLPKHFRTFTTKPPSRTSSTVGASRRIPNSERNSIPFPIELDSPQSNKSTAKDSGYCDSNDSCSDMELVESNEGESELDDLEEKTIVLTDTNRLARSLTESPLAEITKAFTSFGNFALPKSSSPIREHGALPPRKVKPYEKKVYSQTISTRKVKPTPTEGANRALRF